MPDYRKYCAGVLPSGGRVKKCLADYLDKLAPAEAYEKAIFPTVDELSANKTAIVEGWDKVVGANVK